MFIGRKNLSNSFRKHPENGSCEKDSLSMKGQSAIEYLTSYGWMLIVVAVIGAAVYSIAGDQSVETVNGFGGQDVQVDDFGVTSSSEIALNTRNVNAEELVVSKVNVSDPDSGKWVYKEFNGENRIGVGSDKIFELPNVTKGDESNSLDIEIIYGSGKLDNLTVSGTVTGNLQLTDSGSYEGLPEDNHREMDKNGNNDYDFQGLDHHWEFSNLGLSDGENANVVISDRIGSNDMEPVDSTTYRTDILSGGHDGVVLKSNGSDVTGHRTENEMHKDGGNSVAEPYTIGAAYKIEDIHQDTISVISSYAEGPGITSGERDAFWAIGNSAASQDTATQYGYNIDFPEKTEEDYQYTSPSVRTVIIQYDGNKWTVWNNGAKEFEKSGVTVERTSNKLVSSQFMLNSGSNEIILGDIMYAESAEPDAEELNKYLVEKYDVN